MLSVTEQASGEAYTTHPSRTRGQVRQPGPVAGSAPKGLCRAGAKGSSRMLGRIRGCGFLDLLCPAHERIALLLLRFCYTCQLYFRDFCKPFHLPLLPATKDWTVVVTSHLKPLLLPPPAISKSLTTATPNAPSWNTPSGPICFATAGAMPSVCGIPVPSTLQTQVKRQAHSFDENTSRGINQEQ